MLKKLFGLIFSFLLLVTPANVLAETTVAPSDRIVHEPVYPKTYSTTHQPPKFTHPNGQQLGYPPNTLYLKEHEFPFVDIRPKNPKDNIDFVHLNAMLDENQVVAVGNHNMHSFFGHYYDLTGTGVFNPIVDENLIEVGSIAIITDANGYSKGYEFTQILEVMHAEQNSHYYDTISLPTLAFDGNGKDMLYVQYCRWDISYGLLIGNIGYRVW